MFDSNAGEHSPASFKEFSEPYLRYISQNLLVRLAEMGLEPVPMTVFAKGAWVALDSICDLGYNVVGLDWLWDPKEAVKIAGSRPVVFQGNADPGVLYGTREAITEAVKTMVDGFGGGKKGWIANLGHGKSPGQSRLGNHRLTHKKASRPASTPRISSSSSRRYTA